MSDPGLTNRLRQRSRRAGLAVGLSMALTIAVCIATFAWIYAKANPLFTDFVGAKATATQNERQPSATDIPTQAATSSGAESADAPPTETPKPRPTEQPSDNQQPTQTPTATPTSTAFKQTHISNPNLSTNLRPEASTNGDPVEVLPAGTPLQFLNDQQTGDDGQQWFKFRTEDGTEGWMREGTFQEAS
jgi:cytoskeletal protein RodZ